VREKREQTQRKRWSETRESNTREKAISHIGVSLAVKRRIAGRPRLLPGGEVHRLFVEGGDFLLS